MGGPGASRKTSAAETVFSPSAARKGKGMPAQESAANRPSTPSEAKGRPRKVPSKAQSLEETLRETYSAKQMETMEQMKQRQLAVLLLSNQAPQCCNKGAPLMLGRDKTTSKRPGSSGGGFGGAPRFSKAVYEGSADHYAQSTIYKGLLGPGMYGVTCSRTGQYLDMGQPEGRPTTAPASGFGMNAKRWPGPTRYERDGRNAELTRVDPQCSRTGQPLSARQQGSAVSLLAGTRGITLYDGRASLKHSAYGRGSYGPGAHTRAHARARARTARAPRARAVLAARVGGERPTARPDVDSTHACTSPPPPPSQAGTTCASIGAGTRPRQGRATAPRSARGRAFPEEGRWKPKRTARGRLARSSRPQT